ncbi:MAG TPA: M23 family metallopeptidase [Thermoanaerobaculia bacterium]|nr:M23 family metallopeptidase [Thermoanaerobaculia bacterium]
MARSHHTVIFVPHARARLRKWRVTTLQIGLAAALLLALVASSAAVTWSYFNSHVSPTELARLEAENRALRQVNGVFERDLQGVQQQLADYEDRTRQLAIVAGLEGVDSAGEAGIGGSVPLEGPMLAQGIGGLGEVTRRAGAIAGRLDLVDQKLEQRLRWISSTPAISPVHGILTSGFGYRADPLTHGRGDHQGVDIAAAAGQPVRASADGIVLRAGALGGLGNAVYLAHGFGVTTRYGHLSRIDVRPGDRVQRGDVLGLVGNTGRSTGSHLHYEVRIDGDAVDPLAYLLDQEGI